MKKTWIYLLLSGLLLILCACTDPVVGAPAGSTAADPAAPRIIELKGDSASYPGSGVTVKGGVVTIGAPGEYTLRGKLNDGRIVVDLKENPGRVTLILDSADITCLTDSAIHLVQAKELELALAAGSVNRIVSGTEADAAVWTETVTGAAIYAEDNLTISGEGRLTVIGYRNSAVTCKDDLKLLGGTLELHATNNGLRGSESVTVSGGAITIDAGKDGLKSSSATKAGKGYVLIENGTLTIRAGGDGISAETALTISGGEISVETSGDPVLDSCKGLKAKSGLTISGGVITINAQDHAIRSQAALTVSGGEIVAASKLGKGLNAETELLIDGGTLQVIAGDDGISSATAVTIRSGSLDIRSGADGIQGGKKGTGFGETVGSVSIEGGQTMVSAFNKPIDAKASFTLCGGTIFACGGGTLSPRAEIAYLLGSSSGNAGTSLSLANSELRLQAAYPFSTVLYADEALNEGQRYSLQLGEQKLDLTAKK
ncbi:MAG: carbohydrate-binding domain-containing protein [Oscillospiraceae bacterium]|nr:carbohydrate-binding domain-containing protein [Oscillospiraceae bacterium]